jgi:DNA-binding response OmpR family regulator
MKLFVVEDDPNLGFILQDQLEDEGFEVDRFLDGEKALNSYKNNYYDLCVIDIMLPSLDGFNLVKKIRQTDKKTPIIFVTAKSMKEDKIKGFKLGGDDYLTKPFSIEELLLRIHAILRRTGKNKLVMESNFVFSQTDFNSDTRKLIVSGKEKQLTAKENDLLKMLFQNLNDITLREDILVNIWGDNSYYNGRSLDVFITKIRKYLKDDSGLEIISEHGKGYKLLVIEN